MLHDSIVSRCPWLSSKLDRISSPSELATFGAICFYLHSFASEDGRKISTWKDQSLLLVTAPLETRESNKQKLHTSDELSSLAPIMSGAGTVGAKKTLCNGGNHPPLQSALVARLR